LDLIPGFSSRDQKLGSVLSDLASTVFSPLSGALNAAARPFSYIPQPVVDKTTGKISYVDQPTAQQNVANIFGTALMGLGAGETGVGAPIRPADINEGAFGAKPRIGGPTAPVQDAEFTDHVPGVNPADSIVHSSIAEADANNVSRMQEAVAGSKTLTRSPELMQDFLENHTPASGQEVSVPSETITKLWQQGHMVFQGQADQILDSLRSGADVKVPMSQYLTETAGQPFADELNAATRFRENGVSQDEAKTLPQPTTPVTIFHGGADFDILDAGKLGSGEPGGIRPLGKDAFYGSLATGPQDIETAIEHARIYSKYGGDTPMIHAFEADLDPKINNLAYQSPHGRYGDAGNWEAEALPWRPTMELPTAKEIGIKNLSLLRRVGKWPAGTPTSEIMADLERGRQNVLDVNAPMLPDQTGSPEGSAQQFTPNGKTYVVKPATTDPAAVEAMLPTAEKYGGRYAMGRAKTAFQFRTPEARDAFLNELQNPEAESSVEVKQKEPLEIPEDLKEDAPRIQAIAARAESAVSQVFKETALDKLFAEPSATGLTKGQFERFAERVDEARNDVIDRLLEKTYKQIRRERTPEWKAAVDLHKEEATKLIEAQPNVQAYRATKEPLFKIDTTQAAELYPDLPLPAGLTKNGGLSPDEAAELNGYSSGSALVQDLYHLHEAVAANGGTLNDYVKNRVQTYAEEQARQMLGYDVTQEGLVAAAREAMTEPAIEDLLTADLKELALNAGGLPFDKKTVVAKAEELFAKESVKDAIKPKAYAENMRRLGNKAEAGLIDERPLKAFEVKQQQFIQYLMMKQAFTFQKEFGAGIKVMNQIARKPIANGMDQTARNQIRGILQSLGFRMRTGKYEGVTDAMKGVSLDTYMGGLNARGFDPVFANIPTGVHPSDMLVDQFRGVNETVKSIAALGRDDKRAFNNGKAQELSQIGQEVKQNASQIGRPFTAGELHRLQGTMAGGLSSAPRALGASVTRPETSLYWLDREQNGPMMKYVLNELQDGKFYKTDKITEIGKKFREFVKEQPKGWQHSLKQAVDVPELTYSRGADGTPIPWLRDRGNVIMMATHFGTADNFAKLTEGLGWDPATVRKVADRVLTEADWKYVQHILDVNKQLLPDVRALYRATVGLAMKEIPATPIPTPFGELAGGYRHISYDWNALEETVGHNGAPVDEAENEVSMQNDPTALHASDLFGNAYRTATPPNSHTLARTKFSAPMNLEHSILHREIESVIHDLAYRKALIQATKVLRVPAVRQGIREALGPEYLNTYSNWLKDIARGSQYDQTALKGAAALIRGVRRRFTLVQIGYNTATLLKHGGIAAAHIGAEVGVAEFAKASGDLMRDQDLVKWVYDNSGEVRGSLMNLDRDVRELMQDIFRKQGFVDQYRYHAFTMFGKVKQIEATATWLAKYRQLTDKENLPHEDAAALANKSVRDTQGAGGPVDLPALWRGDTSFWSEVGKLSNIFTGFENTATNRAWTMVRRSGRGGGAPPNTPGFNPGKGWDDRGPAGQRRDFQKSFSDLLSFFVIPALWATAFDVVSGGKVHKGVKNGAVFMEHYLENTLKGALGGSLPFGSMLAEVPQAIQNYKKTHKVDFGSDGPLKDMLGSGIATGINAWEALHPSMRNKIEDRWVQHAIETVGYTFPNGGLPVKPFAKGGQFLYDKAMGHVKDKSLAEFTRGLLFGPSPEEAKKHSGR
jgi:hypothetical protein